MNIHLVLQMRRFGASFSGLLLAGVLLCAAATTPAADSAAAITDPEEIRATAVKTVADRAQAGGIRVTATAAPLDARLRLHGCESPLQGFIAGDGQLQSSTTVGVRCESPVRWTLYVRVAISGDQPVLVARHLLPRGSELSADDFELVTRHVDGPGDRFVSSLTAVAGLRLRLPLASGAMLGVDAVEQAPIIHRGQQVTLLARTANMEIRVAAIALSDGRAQQRINVQNQSTHQTIEAVVRSATLVEVGL
jgi:flagella basal body P-ring formation protein FlgA